MAASNGHAAPMTPTERENFNLYLRQCSDAQVQGVYEKEKAAGRQEEQLMAIEEAKRRGIPLVR